ncbi:uncharacterized protein LOC116424397 [Nomia melanderi]|uniref:uncharacterized protein LOC116424397 n=1 Tax=Nomia melanderi TaxID=2448451 RepID=UPI0013043D94|nr:uncharacterized protein LOC116424397 [Nomia melanderi]
MEEHWKVSSNYLLALPFIFCMIVMWCLCLIFGFIAASIGPFCYRKFCDEDRAQCTEKDGNESIESVSPQVHIKISHPHRMCELSNDIFSDTCDSRQNFNDLSDGKEMKQVVQDTKPVSSEEPQVVPVIPPLNRRRLSGKIWSSALKNQLENITNASSDMHGGSLKIVQAQVEARPVTSVSDNCEILDSTTYKPVQHEFAISAGLDSNHNYLNDEKARRPSSIVKKLKNLKTLIWTRGNKSVSFKEFESDETQRLNLPASTQCAPSAQSTILHKSRIVDASTSTRISRNTLETKPQDEENNESSKEQLCPGTEVLQEVMSLLSRPPVNGKSKCDINISGLAVSQSDLLSLLSATGEVTISLDYKDRGSFDNFHQASSTKQQQQTNVK